MNKPLTLYISDNAYLAQAEQIANRYHFHLSYNISPEEKYFLCLNKHGLSLQENCARSKKILFIDFYSGKNQYRRSHGGGKNQQLAKAIGINRHSNLTVLDATAGLGQDAFVLATLGCDITLIEESPIIAALLEDAILRALKIPDLEIIMQRMHFVFGDSVKYMKKIPDQEKPPIVYLDPMFPTRKKSALVKKEMQTLQKILEKKTDEQLLITALNCAKKQVVVKRPRYANYLNDVTPTRSILGRSCRFDIYLLAQTSFTKHFGSLINKENNNDSAIEIGKIIKAE